MRYQNIGSMFFRFVIKHACDGQTDKRTDRQTDRQTSKTAAALALLRRAVNMERQSVFRKLNFKRSWLISFLFIQRNF